MFFFTKLKWFLKSEDVQNTCLRYTVSAIRAQGQCHNFMPSAEHMSMAVHGTSHGANDFCFQQPKTCMVALSLYVL